MTDRRSMAVPLRATLGFVAITVATLIASSTVPVRAATVTVAAMNYEFRPATQTIAAGDVVRWTFAGDPHSVTSRDGLFDSGIMNPGGSFQFKFSAAGTYRYFCQVHPEQMFGTIVVKAAASTPGPTVRPTARPTARPTPNPTQKPSPDATATTGATPSRAPTPSEAVASPSTSPSPTVSAEPTASAWASQAVVETPSPSKAPAAPAPRPTEPASTSDTTAIVAGGVLLAMIVAVGGLLLARRRVAS